MCSSVDRNIAYYIAY